LVGSFVFAAGSRVTAKIECLPSPVAPVQLYAIGNSDSVSPGATALSQFTISWGSPTILSLKTYHIVPDGLKSTGQVGLRTSAGKVYGPWPTTGSPGPGGEANAFWTANVDLMLPPDTYTVTDSDPSSWSANEGTGGAGMFSLTGYEDNALVAAPCAACRPVSAQLYANGNGNKVTPGATAPSWFKVPSGSAAIMWIKTYHVVPHGLRTTGQIGLLDSDGKVYGPWQAIGSPGPGGEANAIWTATIDLELPPGTYTVTDSDPGTWSANAGTGGSGFVWVGGYQDSAPVLPVTETQLYATANGDSVSPGVSVPSRFNVESGSVTVVSLKTYHNVAPHGLKSAGQIGLRGSDGKVYGPWQATGSPGPGGEANAFWTATVDVVLPPGTYTITDSDPSTWSANAGTGGAGMFWVSGFAN
jgi:hypothetical protein